MNDAMVLGFRFGGGALFDDPRDLDFTLFAFDGDRETHLKGMERAQRAALLLWQQ